MCAVTGRVAFAVDFTGADLQCGEQVGGAVPDVVVGAFLGDTEVDRQQRLGPVQGLNLGFLIDGQHHRRAGRVQVQPDDVGDLLGESRVTAELERALPMRFQPVSRHNVAT